MMYQGSGVSKCSTIRNERRLSAVHEYHSRFDDYSKQSTEQCELRPTCFLRRVNTPIEKLRCFRSVVAVLALT